MQMIKKEKNICINLDSYFRNLPTNISGFDNNIDKQTFQWVK